MSLQECQLLFLIHIPEILAQIHIEFHIAWTRLQQLFHQDFHGILKLCDIIFLKMFAKRIQPLLFVYANKTISESRKGVYLN